MNRRQFALAGVAALARAEDAAGPATLVYKERNGCSIQADVYSSAGAKRPVCVHIHGGALIMGDRRLPPRSRQLRLLREAGFTVISIDYRLAPETQLEGIIEDIRDFFTWMEHNAGALGVDPGRTVVTGGSAGGYLTLMTGFAVKPVPKALAPFFGYGDIIGDWYSKPDAFYRRQPLVTREEALAAVEQHAITQPLPGRPRGRFYLYSRQQGLWPKLVSGHDPATEAGWFQPYCPIQNVTRSYPPTMLIHGTSDTDVPYEQSKMMAAKLAQAGAAYELVTVPGGAHGLGNIPPEEQERLHRNAVLFLKRYVS